MDSRYLWELTDLFRRAELIFAHGAEGTLEVLGQILELGVDQKLHHILAEVLDLVAFALELKHVYSPPYLCCCNNTYTVILPQYLCGCKGRRGSNRFRCNAQFCASVFMQYDENIQHIYVIIELSHNSLYNLHSN